MVHDVGSANGVLVNGDRIVTSRVMHIGDVLICGPLRWQLVSDDAPAPTAIRAQPVTETLRALVGSARSGKNHPSATEQMPEAEVAAGLALAVHDKADRAGASKLHPGIVAALGALGLSNAGRIEEPRRQGSTSIRPSEMMPAITSASALSPNRFHEPSAPRVAGYTSDILPSEAPVQATAALEPGAPVQASGNDASVSWWTMRGSRLLAGVGDVLLVCLASVVSGGLIAGAGTFTALLWAGADISNGQLSVSHLEPHTAAAAGDVFTLLLTPGPWIHLDQLARQVHALPTAGPFLLLFLGLAVGAVVAELLMLWGLVAATVQQGGPWLHRRLGLIIIVRRNGHHPGWRRALFRWLLLGLTCPVALITMLCGWRGVHDLVTGCVVRRR